MSTQSAEVPREPPAYSPSLHFPERFYDRYEDDRPPRHLDGEIVDGCIENGHAEKMDPGVYHLRETFGGVTYKLVVNVRKREVITGYPAHINTEAARASGRWTGTEIQDILEFIRTDPR